VIFACEECCTIIQRAEAIWDIQERAGHCEDRTGRMSDPCKEEDDDYLCCTSGNSTPIGESVVRIRDISEMGMDVVQCFR